MTLPPFRLTIKDRANHNIENLLRSPLEGGTLHIRKLEIILDQENRFTYRFYPGEKERRYIYGLNIADSVARSTFIEACRYAFGLVNHPPLPIETVVLECYDDSGTIWTSIRSKQGHVTLKDGEEISRHNGNDQNRAVLSKLNLDILSYEQGCFHAMTTSPTSGSGDRELRILETEQLVALLRNLGLTQEQGPLVIKELPNLYTRLTKLSANLDCQNRLASFINQDLKNKGNIDEFKLRDQIHLLKKVEGALHHYQSAQKLAGKVKTLMNHNKQLLAELPSEHAATASNFNTFEDIFDLARTYISARTGEIHENQAANWFQIFADNMQPDFQHYIESLESIILQGAHVSSRIDMEIRNGSAASEQVEQLKDKAGILHTGRFLFKNMLRQMKTIEESKHQFRNDLSAYLHDVSNLSLRLGEIRENMQNAESRLNSLRTDSSNIFKKTQAHFSDDMATWKRITAATEIAPDISPKEFFTFLSTCILKIQLEAVTAHLDMNLSYLSESKNALIHSIQEWRQLTKSVDTTVISDDTVLISETRRLVRYLHEKEDLRRQIAEQRAEHLAQQSLNKAWDILEQENVDLLNHKGLQSTKIKLENLRLDGGKAWIENCISQIQILGTIRDHTLKNQSQQLHSLQAPFQIINVTGVEKMTELEKVLNTLQKHNENPYFARILLVDATIEKLDLSEMTIGQVKQMAASSTVVSAVAPRKPSVERPSPAPMRTPLPSSVERKTVKPVHPLAAKDKPLSDEAKRALEILTSRPRQRSTTNK